MAARLLGLRVRIEFRGGHGCLSLVSVVCCQVEVTATSQFLIQKSPTDCGVSLRVIYKPRERGGPGQRWSAAQRKKKEEEE